MREEDKEQDEDGDCMNMFQKGYWQNKFQNSKGWFWLFIILAAGGYMEAIRSFFSGDSYGALGAVTVGVFFTFLANYSLVQFKSKNKE